MSALAGPIIDAVEGALQSPDTAGGVNEGQAVFNSDISGLVKEVSEGVVWVFGQVYGSWKWSLSRAQQIGKDFETIQGANQSAILHVTENVLPNSLAYLEGYIFSHGITPLRQSVGKLTTRVKAIETWEATVKTWRKNVADPELAQFKTFYGHWLQSYLPAVKVLMQWLQNPSVLARLLAGPIIAPLVGQLGQDEHTTGRDALALLLVRSWDDDTNNIWEAILQWVVSEK